MVLKGPKTPINHETINKMSDELPINFCPSCGHKINETRSFIDRYFNSDRNIDFFWCSECNWRGEITKIIHVTATEIDEG